MNMYNMIKWEELQTTDMIVRDVQLAFEKIKIYGDCDDITNYNKYLEELRSCIHKKMNEVNKSI